ncbi:MAG: hypothetical protein AAGD35_20800 [Actinomycetota bacterium]
MALRKLTSTDAFVFTDLDGAPASGVVRRARKILQGGAKELARSATYAFGAFGIERVGASAGINADGDGIDDAVAAFVTELVPTVADGELHLDAAKGLAPAQLAELRAASTAGPWAGSPALLAAGVTAATAWALGGDLSGATVAIEGEASAPPVLKQLLTEAGATVAEVAGIDEKPWLLWSAEVDAILLGSKAGVLNHQGIDGITARALVPWGPIPITTKAFAGLWKGGAVTVLPDFVTAAGALVGSVLDGDEAHAAAELVGRINEVLDDAASSDDGVLLGACHRAEAFIEGWHGSKPFGRPLAG